MKTIALLVLATGIYESLPRPISLQNAGREIARVVDTADGGIAIQVCPCSAPDGGSR